MPTTKQSTPALSTGQGVKSPVEDLEKMELIAITPDGTSASKIENLPKIARDVMSSTSQMYRVAGYKPRWIGYLTIDDRECVGTCAFKAAPMDDRVEIAYFIFPGNEDHGVATQMAQRLIKIARCNAPMVRIYAQTLPEKNASTRVLEKLGFRKIGVVQHPEDGAVWEWEVTEDPHQGAALDGGSAEFHPRQ